MLVVVFLSGCTKETTALERAMQLRSQLTAGNGCAFDVVVTADYSEHIYQFRMHCQTDRSGDLMFSVVAPETIAGISGIVTTQCGKIVFDDKVLAFDTIVEGNVSPVSAPWLMIKTLCGGYIKACSEDSDGLYIQIDDSYAENSLFMEIWTNGQDLPVRGEILWEGRRILSMDVDNFEKL